MAARWRPRSRTVPGVAAWITREFTARGLAPPHCTPAALAEALARERQLTIVFQPHASEDAGVYGQLYRPAGWANTYVILFRPTHSLALRRLIAFHELAHLLFHHALTEVGRVGVLCGYMVSDEDDARAEAFAVGAMHYSFLDPAASTGPAEVEEDGAVSAFGAFLKRTQYQP